MDPIPLPAPIGGINDIMPLFGLQSPDCESLVNFNFNQAGIEIRKGNSVNRKIAHGGYGSNFLLSSYGNTTLYALNKQTAGLRISVFNMNTGAVDYNPITNYSSEYWYSLNFNKYLFFLHPLAAAPGVVYNGAAWGAIGWTPVAGSPATFIPRSGNVFNNRAYIVQDNDAAYWYTDLYSVTGAVLHYVDLNTITKEKTELASICSVAISDTISSVNLQAFLFFNGEVLFYSGSYPDSADWRLVARGKIGQLVDYDATLEYQGDTLVLCDTGLISLRDLFLKGSEGAVLMSISYKITNSIQNAISTARGTSKPYGPLNNTYKLIYDSKTHRIIILSKKTPEGSPQTYYFIYDTVLKAWSTHTENIAGHIVTTMATMANKVYLCSANGTNVTSFIKEGATSTLYMDRNIDDNADLYYDYDFISAPVAQGRAYVQQCMGLDVFLENGLTDLKFVLTKNFGEGSSTPQSISVTSSIPTKPFVNIGIEGSYIQYQITGFTDASASIGLAIYGINFWESLGSEPR